MVFDFVLLLVCDEVLFVVECDFSGLKFVDIGLIGDLTVGADSVGADVAGADITTGAGADTGAELVDLTDGE